MSQNGTADLKHNDSLIGLGIAVGVTVAIACIVYAAREEDEQGWDRVKRTVTKTVSEARGDMIEQGAEVLGRLTSFAKSALRVVDDCRGILALARR